MSLPRTILMLLVAVCTVHPAMADNERQADQPQGDPAAVEHLYAEFAAMEPEHAYFKQFVGDWKATNKMFIEGAPEPIVSEGSSTFRLLLGGRYLQQTYQGEFAGERFEGIGINGYDKTKKKYVGLWMDSASTVWMLTEGEYDKATETMSDAGTAPTPFGPEKTKTVTKMIDKDTMLFTMYMIGEDGKETKSMEITYSRVPTATAPK